MTQLLGYPWHHDILNHVKEQLLSNRMPHTVLYRHRPSFYDEELARQIARLLLCDSHQGCNDCQHCRLMAESTHPNVMLLNVREEKVGIADVRALEQQMWQTAVFDKPKVAVIDGIDLLSIGAQNALLKTLEEPPKNTFFILSVNHLSNVLPTIMSRVQRLHHTPQKEKQHDEIIHWLQQRLGADAPTEAEISKIARLAQFAPAATLSLLQSPEQVKVINQEKAHFAQFISGQCRATQLVDAMDKEQITEQLIRYSHYVDALIHSLFDKMAKQGNNQTGERQEPQWQGVSLQGLYRLHDVLVNLRRLANTNVNMIMQLQTDLMDWQDDRTK